MHPIPIGIFFKKANNANEFGIGGPSLLAPRGVFFGPFSSCYPFWSCAVGEEIRVSNQHRKEKSKYISL
jgi:hypothetical protein